MLPSRGGMRATGYGSGTVSGTRAVSVDGMRKHGTLLTSRAVLSVDRQSADPADAWLRRPTASSPCTTWPVATDLRAYHLAWLVTDHAIPAMPDDKLFVEHEVYRWRMADERALAAYWTGRYEVALALWQGYPRQSSRQRNTTVLDNINWAQQTLTSS